MFGYLAGLPLIKSVSWKRKGYGNTSRYVRLPCRLFPDESYTLEEERAVETQQDMVGYLADLPLINSVYWKRKGKHSKICSATL
jgi:hypothetical protein